MLAIMAIQDSQHSGTMPNGVYDRRPIAFWLDNLCTPDDRYIDENGEQITITDKESPEGLEMMRKLKNQDVSTLAYGI